ncbi:AIPR family protein [Vibrio rhodolitus]|uniref:AIPR family protein n=1 Tax=Vibrio rhodolitus TaxID=2231649 RepID=UPI001AC00097|nr:AIPR family protein [Vibrio rhodolitus]
MLAFGSIAHGLLVDSQVIPDCELTPSIQIGGRNRKSFISAFYNEEFERLDVVTSIFIDEVKPKTVPREVIKKSAYEALRGAKSLLENDLSSLSGDLANDSQIETLLNYRNKITYIQIYVLTNGKFTDWETTFNDDTSVGCDVDVDVYDITRLERLLDTKHSRDNILIDFEDQKLLGRPLDCLEMKPAVSEYGTYLAIFTGELLFNLYEKYGAQLFEFNVRSFLSNRGKINRGIRDTIKNQPQRFMAYNNGLVATADEIEVASLDGQLRIHKMRGFQIVNGAQTTASIHRTAKQDKADISQINVSVKITKVSEDLLEEIVPLISKYANSQNNVQVADLSANHRFHIWFERLSREIWVPGEKSKWFYERARGSYDEELFKEGTTPKKKKEFITIYPKSQKLSKTDLAKIYVGWQRKPFQVTTGAQKNFSKFMLEIDEITSGQGKTSEPSVSFFKSMISKRIIQSSIQKICRKELSGHRSEITNYTFSSLSYLYDDCIDLDMVWSQQKISDEMIDYLTSLVLDIDALIRESSNGQNITEWCKKEDCWVYVSHKLDNMRSHQFIFPERSEVVNNVDMEVGESQDYFKYNEYTSTQWKRAAGWAMLNNTTTTLSAQVTMTLAQYAANNWMKTPSDKQLKHAIPVMLKAMEAGVFDENGDVDEK